MLGKKYYYALRASKQRNGTGPWSDVVNYPDTQHAGNAKVYRRSEIDLSLTVR